MAVSLVLGACSSASNAANTGAEKAANEGTTANVSKTVHDTFGDVVIPAEPKNLLVTNSSYAEYLIEMGIVPQMVLMTFEVEPEYRAPYFEKHGVKMIESDQYQYNYEQLLALSPDLILTQGGGMEKTVYDELSKIAPTVALNTNSEMEAAMPLMAELFDKTAESAKVLAENEEKVEQAKTKIAQAIGDKTVLVLRVESTRYRYLGSKAGDSSKFFYQTLGLHIPEIFKDSEDWFTPFSLEILPDIKPDYIFLEERALKGYDASQSLKDLENNPLWQNMDAVKNGHVFR